MNLFNLALLKILHRMESDKLSTSPLPANPPVISSITEDQPDKKPVIQTNEEAIESDKIEDDNNSEFSDESDCEIRRSGRKRRSRGSTFTRKLWNDEEDDAILSLVQTYGIRRWTLISKKLQENYHIHGRSGKQCRERYFIKDFQSF